MALRIVPINEQRPSIYVSIQRDRFGNERVYPECSDAKRFAQLAKSKTLSDDTLELISGLGYGILPIETESKLEFVNDHNSSRRRAERAQQRRQAAKLEDRRA